MFTTSKKPPVALSSTVAPKSFLLVKETKAHLNFCHSIEPSVGGDIQKFDWRELGESFGTAKYIPRELESVRVESQVVQFVTAPTIETNGDVDDGAGKYFSSEVEGVHVELAVVKSVSAPTTETNGEAVDGVEEWLFRGIRRHDKALWTEPAYDVCHDLDMAGL